MANQPNAGTSTPRQSAASNAASAPTKPRQKQLAAATPSGLTPVHLGRRMKVYPVTDVELTSLAEANTQANAFGAAATTCVGSAITLWAESTISAPSTAMGELLLKFGPWVLLALGGLFGLLWLFGLKRRSSIIANVRSTAVETELVQRR